MRENVNCDTNTSIADNGIYLQSLHIPQKHKVAQLMGPDADTGPSAKDFINVFYT